MFAKTFRNTLIASSLLVGASLLAGPAAMAQNSGDVLVNVDGFSSVTYAQPATTPTLTSSNTSGMDFGTVTVSDNTFGGWVLNVASLNGGVLVHETDTDSSIAYTEFNFSNTELSINTTVDNLPVNSPVEAYTAQSTMCATLAGCDIVLTADIDFDAVDGMPAGDYKDTLTFTLTAKDAAE